MDALTLTERCAVLGMQALARELSARYQDELHRHAMQTYEMLADIAVAHGLPVDAFLSNAWGIDMTTMAIVPMPETTPAGDAP